MSWHGSYGKKTLFSFQWTPKLLSLNFLLIDKEWQRRWRTEWNKRRSTAYEKRLRALRDESLSTKTSYIPFNLLWNYRTSLSPPHLYKAYIRLQNGNNQQFTHNRIFLHPYTVHKTRSWSKEFKKKEEEKKWKSSSCKAVNIYKHVTMSWGQWRENINN